MPPDDIWKILNRNDHHIPVKDAEDFLRPLLRVPDITADHVRTQYTSQVRSGSHRRVKFHQIASGHLLIKIVTHGGTIDLTVRIPETQKANRPAFLTHIVFEYEESGIFVDVENSNLFKTKDYETWPKEIRGQLTILYQVQENEKQKEKERDEAQLKALLQRTPTFNVPEVQGVQPMSLTENTPETVPQETSGLKETTDESGAETSRDSEGREVSTEPQDRKWRIDDFPTVWHFFLGAVKKNCEKNHDGNFIVQTPTTILRQEPDITAKPSSASHFLLEAQKRGLMERQGSRRVWLVKDTEWPERQKAKRKEIEQSEETPPGVIESIFNTDVLPTAVQESAKQLTLLEALVMAFQTNQKPRSILAERFPIDGDFLSDELELKLEELQAEAQTKIATIERAVRLAGTYLESVKNLILIQEDQEG